MKPSYVAVGVIGLALGGLWYAGGGSQPPAAEAAEALRVSDPVTHENLTVFFVRGPSTVDDSRVVTLQEALENRWAVVHETGNVNQLVVENLSPDHDLFVQSGDLIKGGRQDRLIAADLLVPPAAGKVPVPVHCVEHGRWSGRPNDEAAQFGKSDSFAVGNDIKLANARRDQGQVWDKVKAKQDELTKNVGVQVNAAESPTSLQLALENPAVRAKAEAYRSALRSAGCESGVIGAVFVVNGKMTSAEVYGSTGLFRKAWPKLLKAASEEALAEKTSGRVVSSPTARDVELFLVSAGTEAPAAEQPREMAEMALNGRSGATRAGRRATGDGNPGLNFAPTLPTPVALFNEDLGGAVADIDGVALNPGGQPGGQPAPNQNQLGRRTNLNNVANQAVAYRGITAGLTPTFAENQLTVTGAAAPILFTRSAATVGNRLDYTCVEDRSTLMLESKDVTRNTVIHRSYIKK